MDANSITELTHSGIQVLGAGGLVWVSVILGKWGLRNLDKIDWAPGPHFSVLAGAGALAGALALLYHALPPALVIMLRRG